MNEEKSGQIDNSELSHIDIVADRVLEKTTLTLYLKVTDSDIRSVEVNPNIDTVASLKSKVKLMKGFLEGVSSESEGKIDF
jgi:bisphosphoglycerate-independent phosphoglycerate mutase (AlkP superfamily)